MHCCPVSALAMKETEDWNQSQQNPNYQQPFGADLGNDYGMISRLFH